jgi:hypothetical protein
MITWIEALKIFNKDRDKWLIPKKGTTEYDQVRKIMSDGEISGDGLIELDLLPPNFKKWLNKYGDSNINAIYICRVPVQKIFTNLLNIFTRNGLERNLKKYNYDDLLHTFILYHMKKDNSFWLVERNGRLDVFKYDQYKPHPEYSGRMKSELVVIPKDRTVNDMFENHKNFIGGWDKMIWYHPLSNNCQKFVLNHLSSNGLLTSAYDRFINQDVRKIFKEYPITIKFVEHVIGLGIVLENILNTSFNTK